MCQVQSKFKRQLHQNVEVSLKNSFLQSSKANGSHRKTVMVYIHGGSFTSGSGSGVLYGPDFLLSQDNIVVTIQYRLGVFGFVNLGHSEYTGNMGLKDQQLALKWIHQNIEKFSGNPNEVLIFGESAGKFTTLKTQYISW